MKGSGARWRRQDLSPEQARDIRARAWRLVFDCYAKKKAGVPSTGDDPKGGSKNDSRAAASIP